MQRILKPRRAGTAKDFQSDARLRRHPNSVFTYMGGGLILSALVAFAVANVAPLAVAIFGTPLKWVAIFAPIALVLFASIRFEKLSMGALQGVFRGFALLMGVSLASELLVLTGASIVQAFLSAAVVFLAMALWGYTTKRDVSGWGSCLMIGLAGVIAALIVNLFLASGTLSVIVSIIAVIVFTGLTAWDMQRLRTEYFAYSGTNAVAGQASLGKLQVMGALSLCLNFINLFRMLLSLFGQRQEGQIMRTQETVASMLCPVCKTDLSMSDRGGVESDFRPSCRGVWLDRGELGKIIERTQPPIVGDVERGRDTEDKNSPGRRGGPSGLMGMAASLLQGNDDRHDRSREDRYDDRYDKPRPSKKKSILSEFSTDHYGGRSSSKEGSPLFR